ncbi:MAG: NAD(P)H-binding protein [Anaerolineales bacterium]|nr:NAD(P)H-binding protein [Anaerolineales bacterium]MDW8445848.1 NAD(P)H-binding protein [Anaerolineales bacterium]
MNILITGGTGFIGRTLVRKLVEAGHQVRLLIRPGRHTPKMPRDVPVQIALGSVVDARGLRAAMSGMEVVVHLASAERQGVYADLMRVDINGTRLVAQIAKATGVKRLVYLSHLGADRFSAFPVSKAKGLAEEAIRTSGVRYTIFRSGVAFGKGDILTSGIAQLLSAIPFLFFVPGDGKALLQPIWVEDLSTVITWAIEDPQSADRVYEIGGPEMLSFCEIVETVMEVLGQRRRFFYLPPPLLRGVTIFLETSLPRFPVSVFWLDYLAVNHACAIDTLPRVFQLKPSRLSQRIDYLKEVNWRRVFWNLIRGKETG